MAGAKRTQPEWLSPEGQIEGLRLYNSMTRKKVRIVDNRLPGESDGDM
jgi:hypothetical protein